MSAPPSPQNTKASLLQARCKVWLEADGGSLFGTGVAALLLGIQRHGTMTGAARAAGMSYRHAWDLVKSVEAHLEHRLVISQPGGHGGGNTALSPQGVILLRVFRQLQDDVANFTRQRFEELLRSAQVGIGGVPAAPSGTPSAPAPTTKPAAQ